MTEDYDKRQQKIKEIYRYDGMSNQVLRADRSLIENKTDVHKDAELSQPKSMLGRVSVKEMGSALKETSLEESERVRAEKEFQKRIGKTSKGKERQKGRKSVLDDISSLYYYPTDERNTEIHDQIIAWCSTILGDDIPHSVLLDATDLIIDVLKKDDGQDLKKKQALIENGLDIVIGENAFSSVVNLVSMITDYENNSTTSDGIAIIEANEEDEAEEEGEGDDANPLLNEINEEEDEYEDLEDKPSDNLSEDLDATKRLFDDKEVLQFTSIDKNSEKLSINDIDVFFLQRKLRSELPSVEETKIQQYSTHIYDILSEDLASKNATADLTELLGANNAALVSYILANKEVIFWGHRLASVKGQKIDSVISEMKNKGLTELAEACLKSEASKKRRSSEDEDSPNKRSKHISHEDKPIIVDLEGLRFDQGSKLLATTKIALPENSFKRVKPGYEEIHIPPPQKCDDNFPLVEIKTLPKWAQSAFPVIETSTLNRVQSEVFPQAFQQDTNLLLCAPTGAGKTNVAMLTVLRAMSHFYKEEENKFDLKKFKIVYIAPLKALVQEQVREFQRRLHHLDIKVAELTGDSNLTKQQISDTQILVVTPEKWDVITRKSTETSFDRLVRLIIIDEVHLLHDERGPVLESIVARTTINKGRENSARLVALSATLPNFNDVAKFLQVPQEGLFYFNSSFRPCPLGQQFCGITEKNTLKKKNAMNQACYDKVLDATKHGHQVIIFVHSRKETKRTAKWLMQKLIEEEKIDSFMNSDSGSIEILKSESKNANDKALSELIPQGFAIHHAGLSRDDRSLSEDLFADGLIKVLVSTATLAWGVNLPAHTVIIKGTEVYSPEFGDWTMLSPQDILQMLGRAGRPRYDSSGEGIIITQQSDVRYYLAVLNQQLPIESQMMARIMDNLNAEVVLGTVKSRSDAVEWLGKTYLFVRMLKSPELYHISSNSRYENDPKLMRCRDDIAHSVLRKLHNHNLLIYNEKHNSIESTELGRIASHFYIKYTSIAMYNHELNINSSLIDVLRIFAMSDEFRNMSVRQEEKTELSKLIERAPIPIKEDESDPLAKCNVLVQSYISRLKLEGFALNSDMIYITQSGGRLFRALFEICLRKGWPRLTKLLLTICKCLDHRMWPTNSLFREFDKCPLEVIKRAEASSLPWNDFLSLKNPNEMAEALRSPPNGKLAYDLLRRYPKIELSCSMQPITPSLILFELEMNPDWIWDMKYNGYAENFLLIVEDTDGERTLYNEEITIGMNSANETVYIDFVIFINQPTLPPNYFISVISEKWLHCEYKIPIIFKNMLLPKQFPSPSLIKDIKCISKKELQIEEFISLYDFSLFNKFQSAVFDTLYHENENTLICASKGAGKTIMAELALLNHWKQGKGRAVYICSSKRQTLELAKTWRKRFSHLIGGKVVNSLSDNISTNINLLAQSHLILATPEEFDYISRRWRQRKNIQRIELIIFDDVHNVSNGLNGAIYETIITRMVFISTQLESSLRIVGLSSPLANAKDFGEWIGAKKSSIFNFESSERQVSLKIELEKSEITHDPSLNLGLWKSVLESFVSAPVEDCTSNVFVADRHQCISVAAELTRLASSKGVELLRTEESSLASYLKKVSDQNVKTYLKSGIGIIYEGMSLIDRGIVAKLHNYKVLSILVITRDCCYDSPHSNTVIISTTRLYEGKENRFIDYSTNEILEMVGTAVEDSEGNPGVVKIITTSQRKEYYKKFLREGLPTESFMPYYVLELLSSELANSTIETKQDCIDLLTFTYLYRRIHGNPSYYGVKEVSPEEISSYLTDLVEDAVQQMKAADIIELNEEADRINDDSSTVLLPLSGCAISSYYPVSCGSVCIFNRAVSKSLRLKNMIELLSSCMEFQSIPIRSRDSALLKRLYDALPLKLSSVNSNRSTQFKVFVLLQAHFSKIKLPIDLELDRIEILKKAPSLVGALVDVLSSNGYLSATTAMDLCQMVVQGIWDTDSPLKQVPYFDDSILQKCDHAQVQTIYDIMALEDEEREQIITLPNEKLNKVAEFVNSYPNIELKYSIDMSTPFKLGEVKTLEITITRDEEPESLQVISEAFPYERTEGWWVFVGNRSKKQLYSIKKVNLSKEQQTYQLSIEIDEPGEHTLTLWCVCDSYLQADKEVSFKVTIIE